MKHIRASSTLFNYDKRSHSNSFKNNDVQLNENPDYGTDMSDTAGGSIREGSIPAGRMKTDVLRNKGLLEWFSPKHANVNGSASTGGAWVPHFRPGVKGIRNLQKIDQQ